MNDYDDGLFSFRANTGISSAGNTSYDSVYSYRNAYVPDFSAAKTVTKAEIARFLSEDDESRARLVNSSDCFEAAEIGASIVLKKLGIYVL